MLLLRPPKSVAEALPVAEARSESCEWVAQELPDNHTHTHTHTPTQDKPKRESSERNSGKPCPYSINHRPPLFVLEPTSFVTQFSYKLSVGRM